MKRIFHFLLLASAWTLAQADEPITPSSMTTFCSPAQTFCASSSRSTNVTVINPQRSGERSWTLNEFVQSGFLSDDGNWVASCYGGLDLIPSDAGRDFLIAVIYGRDGSKKVVRLGEIFSDLGKLPETVSHKQWGLCRGVSDGGLKVKKYDGSVVVIPLK